jgi:hypothetical protein
MHVVDQAKEVAEFWGLKHNRQKTVILGLPAAKCTLRRHSEVQFQFRLIRTDQLLSIPPFGEAPNDRILDDITPEENPWLPQNLVHRCLSMVYLAWPEICSVAPQWNTGPHESFPI